MRKLTTPEYGGGGAVIFLVAGMGSSTAGAVDQVIRIFGANDAPLDIALASPGHGGKYATDTAALAYYSDAGIIDISTDGNAFHWLPFNSHASGAEYDGLKAEMTGTRNAIKLTYGTYPFSCTVPVGAINQANYAALQSSGYKVLCSSDLDKLKPSLRPVSWSGEIEAGGLYRLPITGTVSGGFDASQIPRLVEEAKKSVDALGAAVIQIDIASLATEKGRLDQPTVMLITDLLKSCRNTAAITTLEGWYGYISDCPPDATGIKRPLPPYNGGPIIIFRLDDVALGYREEVVQEIIKFFQRNGVPLDCGVVSNVSGTDSFKIPWMKRFVDDNAVGLSVHGYDWTFYQLDITRQYLTNINDDPCINIQASKAEAEKAKISYDELKTRLMQARCGFLKYYGINPVAFTVPTDYYDELGFKAIQDAGYEVFSVHRSEESCPSNVPVDYFCHTDLNKGMYRLPTSYDVCTWHFCKWDEVYNIDKPMARRDYCIYVDAFGESVEYNDFAISACTDMNANGVAVISLHPDCFTDKDGKPDTAKLQKVEPIISWFKSFATIMTFEQWYRYRTRDR